jgi:hypothetical protein
MRFALSHKLRCARDFLAVAVAFATGVQPGSAVKTGNGCSGQLVATAEFLPRVKSARALGCLHNCWNCGRACLAGNLVLFASLVRYCGVRLDVRDRATRDFIRFLRLLPRIEGLERGVSRLSSVPAQLPAPTMKARYW